MYVSDFTDARLGFEFVFVGGGELFVGFDAADESGLFKDLANGGRGRCRRLGFEGIDKVDDLLGFVGR